MVLDRFFPNRLLAAKGIHFLITRFGPTWLRGWAFDAKYRRGDWQFKPDSASQLAAVVRYYLRCGDLLILGCGGSAVLEGLESSGLKSAIGVDLSKEALDLANRYASPRVSFVQCDMLQYEPPRPLDVILLSESIYYVPETQRENFLIQSGQHLKNGGVVIVTLAQPKRYAQTVEMIRGTFSVIEDRTIDGSSRQLLVFSPKDSGKTIKLVK